MAVSSCNLVQFLDLIILIEYILFVQEMMSSGDNKENDMSSLLVDFDISLDPLHGIISFLFFFFLVALLLPRIKT